MSSPPQSRPAWRFPRAHLEGTTPAVLRFPNGQHVGANLQVISLSGGLVSLSQPVVPGTRVKMMFLTGTGSVLGGAEMLHSVTSGLQPFRFVSLAADDHRRLEALIWQRAGQNQSDFEWIEKLRAASAQPREPWNWRLKVAAAAGLFMISLATAAYLLRFGVFK
jgi:hypothetical protein